MATLWLVRGGHSSTATTSPPPPLSPTATFTSETAPCVASLLVFPLFIASSTPTPAPAASASPTSPSPFRFVPSTGRGTALVRWLPPPPRPAGERLGLPAGRRRRRPARAPTSSPRSACR